MQNEAEKKLSHKGVPKSVALDDHDYLNCLYNDEPGYVFYGNIQISKKECHAKTRSITKRALNGLYMKFHVEKNRVSVRPHMINGNFLWS